MSLAVPPPSSREKRLQPRKRPRQPRAEETRARILEAARVVFAEHGYSAGTTNRIAEQASMSVGSLYQYFPNKDAILVELVHQHMEEGTAALTPILDEARTSSLPVRDLVERVVRAFVELHHGQRRLHQVLFEESPRPPSLLQDLHAIEDGAVAIVAEVLEEAERPPADPHLSARIAVTTVESLVHRMVATEEPLDVQAFERELVRLVAGYLDPASIEPATSGSSST